MTSRNVYSAPYSYCQPDLPAIVRYAVGRYYIQRPQRSAVILVNKLLRITITITSIRTSIRIDNKIALLGVRDVMLKSLHGSCLPAYSNYTSRVEGHGGVGLYRYDFLLVPHNDCVPICYSLAAIEHGKVATLSFRFQGHRRSKVKVAFDPPHMSSY